MGLSCDAISECPMEHIEVERPRRRAAKLIAAVERNGGFLLSCGCLVPCAAGSLRRLMEWTSPEIVIELAVELASGHEHSAEETGRHDVRVCV